MAQSVFHHQIWYHLTKLTNNLDFTVELHFTCKNSYLNRCILLKFMGGGPSVVVSTAAFQARVQGSVPGPGLKETKNVSSPSTCESQYCGEPP